jgi:hypothetical protein
VVELEYEVRCVEIVTNHVEVITPPERLYYFAVLCRVLRDKTVVLLTSYRRNILVERSKCGAGAKEACSSGAEVRTIADMRMRLHYVRHLRTALGCEIRERAGVDAGLADCTTNPIVQ